MKLSKLFKKKIYTETELPLRTTIENHYYDFASCGNVLRREGHWFNFKNTYQRGGTILCNDW